MGTETVINVETGETIVAADPPSEAELLALKRAAAVLDRAAFCKRLRQLGVLPAAEAVTAAQGGWPATFTAFAASLPADVAADAQIDWAAATTIRYSAPLLQQLALSYASGNQANATAILDQIFQIT